MSGMEIAEHIDALLAEGTALAEAADKAGLDTDVAPCPGWTVADLIKHTGYVHRWAARNVTEQPATAIDGGSEEHVLNSGPNDELLIPWFRDGFTALAQTLRTADPAGACPVFLPNTISPLAFWARRQAHETAVHRGDAELAAGRMPAYDKGFAADGIDELITGFAARTKRPPEGALGRSMLVRAADSGNAWRITWPVEPGTRATCERLSSDDHEADCVLTGPAEGLYLLLWNRVDAPAARVTIEGDSSVADAWHGFRVRW
jgi:uncharacterized protein (TIGR03083 family)